MKPENVRDALMMLEALDGLVGIDAAIANGLKPSNNGEPCCEIQVGHYDENGGVPVASAYLPWTYARELIPIARRRLIADLMAIGVEIEDPEIAAALPLYERAVALVRREGKASASLIQRKFLIGFNKAANLLDEMQEAGIVTPMDEKGRRKLIEQSEAQTHG